MPHPTTPKTPAAWLRRTPPRSFWRLPLTVAAELVPANLIWYSLEVFEAAGKLVPEIEEVATVLDNTLMSWPTLMLLGLALIGWLAGHVRLTRGLLYFALVTATDTLLVSMGVLIYTLAYREGDVDGLIWDAALVWAANVLVFAFWYWPIDGEHARARASTSCSPSARARSRATRAGSRVSPTIASWRSPPAPRSARPTWRRFRAGPSC